MSPQPRLLDLFCGAGGATKGYQRAGFYVVGVDVDPQPNYCGDEFFQDDALAFWDYHWIPDGGDFAAVHASPPCQAYVGLSAKDGRHPKLVEPIQRRFRECGVPYVIENTGVAPLKNPVILCGSMFGLGVRRHRKFETSFLVTQPECQHDGQDIRGYYGRNYGPALVSKDAIQRRGRKPLFRGTVAEAPRDMGIDWMEWDELRESIPPAYTEWIGRELMQVLERREVSRA